MGRLDFEPFVFQGTLTCDAIPRAVDDLSNVVLMVSLANDLREPPILPNADVFVFELELVPADVVGSKSGCSITPP